MAFFDKRRESADTPKAANDLGPRRVATPLHLITSFHEEKKDGEFTAGHLLRISSQLNPNDQLIIILESRSPRSLPVDFPAFRSFCSEHVKVEGQEIDWESELDRDDASELLKSLLDQLYQRVLKDDAKNEADLFVSEESVRGHFKLESPNQAPVLLAVSKIRQQRENLQVYFELPSKEAYHLMLRASLYEQRALDILCEGDAEACLEYYAKSHILFAKLSFQRESDLIEDLKILQRQNPEACIVVTIGYHHTFPLLPLLAANSRFNLSCEVQDSSNFQTACEFEAANWFEEHHMLKQPLEENVKVILLKKQMYSVLRHIQGHFKMSIEGIEPGAKLISLLPDEIISKWPPFLKANWQKEKDSSQICNILYAFLARNTPRDLKFYQLHLEKNIDEAADAG